MQAKSENMGAPVEEKALEGVTGGGPNPVFPTIGNDYAGLCPGCLMQISSVQRVEGWTTSCLWCGQKVVYSQGSLCRAD